MSYWLDFCLIMHPYLDHFIDFLFSLYYNSSKKRIVSKPCNLLVTKSATTLARKIREKSITSEEVVRAFIERINVINPIINAVTDNRFFDAISEAKEIDRDIASGKINQEDFKKKPFLGVPFTAKETIPCRGLKNTFGILRRKDFVAEYDADAVILLKAAGAILLGELRPGRYSRHNISSISRTKGSGHNHPATALGATNVSQLEVWQETTNPVFGVTKNPYDTTRSVGGSSGGGAAITAACGAPFGIGTDIGGSLRIPAFMCGTFGHKPTNALVSAKGIVKRPEKEASTMAAIGTFTNCTEDIIPILKVLLGPNIKSLKLDENVDVKNLQVHYVFEYIDWKVSSLEKEMCNAMLRTVDYFRRFSNKAPQKMHEPSLNYGGELWRYCMTQEDGVKFKATPAELTSQVLHNNYTVGTLFNLFAQQLPEMDPKWANQIIQQLRANITEKLGNNGVLLYPSSPWSARYHGTAIFRPCTFYYCAVWNALKLPVTQVPLGLDSEGLPIGIQVVAAPFQDHLCIAVAKQLEKEFGGYVPPFNIEK